MRLGDLGLGGAYSHRLVETAECKVSIDGTPANHASVFVSEVPPATRNAKALTLSPRAWAGFVLILALGVRLYDLGGEDFWQDEIHSMYNSACARGPAEHVPDGVILRDLPRYSDLTEHSTLGGVWRTMEDDSHPPIYFMLLLIWRWIVGDGEAWIRVMPVFFSTLSILAAMLTLRELKLSRAGLVVGFMLAVGFCHINMAQENRPYSLSALLVNVSFLLLVRMESRWVGWTARQRRWGAGLYAGTLFAAMMNHYFAGFTFVGQAVYVAIRWRGPLLRAWLVSSAAAAVLFCVVWGPHLWKQRDFIASQDWLLEPQADHVERTVLRVADMPIRLCFRVNRTLLSERNALLGAGLLAASGIGLLLRRSKQALLFVCWYLIPLLLFAVIDLAAVRQHLTHFRYISVAIPGLVGLFALALEEMRAWQRGIGVAVYAMACIPTLVTLPAQDNPQARMVMGLIRADLKPDDLVIFDAVTWPSFWALRMYQMLSYYLPAPSPTMLLLRDPPSESLLAEIREFDHLYVVTPNPKGIPNPTPRTHPFLEKSDYFDEIGWVYRCSRQAPTADLHGG